MENLVWSVDPILLKVGPVSVHWYGVLFGMAFLVGFSLMRSVFRKEGKPERYLDPLWFYMGIGTVVGARLGHVLFYDPAYYLSHPLQIVAVWNGGLASHGGAIGIALALYLFSRRHPETPYVWLLDRMAIPAVLGGCFIRIGNFFNSEIAGLPSNLPWAVIFQRIDELPRHPTQLYEALCYFLIFWLLYATYQRRYPALPQGMLSGLFLVLVFVARFFLEFTKMPQASFEGSMPLSVGQLLSIPTIVVGLILLWRCRKVSSLQAPPGPGVEAASASEKSSISRSLRRSLPRP
ncbi:prolipoprotein diacylglyceryl transferase [Pseudomonas fulva]|uniref:prolipoprotein diacylglyceryl transferase n=1 Tax=Pseudomonas fulva TaxID=47880 RepID=UPI001428A827|nr:prolipoprotein diacylglyceryl transferase [Pseudomonas fulva]NIX94374.1 prolipoprotein diacylglyceryl transferase [Pseudomonas fulva]